MKNTQFFSVALLLSCAGQSYALNVKEQTLDVQNKLGTIAGQMLALRCYNTQLLLEAAQKECEALDESRLSLVDELHKLIAAKPVVEKGTLTEVTVLTPSHADRVTETTIISSELPKKQTDPVIEAASTTVPASLLVAPAAPAVATVETTTDSGTKLVQSTHLVDLATK